MNYLQLKREQFRQTFHQQQRLKFFQDKREKMLQLAKEEKCIKEIEEKIASQILQLHQLLQTFDSEAFTSQLNEMSKQIIEIIRELKKDIKQIRNPDLKQLTKMFYLIACFQRHNFQNSFFVEMIDFLDQCCKSSLLFCSEYCNSLLYKEVLYNLEILDHPYSLEVLKHAMSIYSDFSHKLPCEYINQLIKTIIKNVENQKILQQYDKQIMCVVIEIFLNLDVKAEQMERIKFMQQINQYYLAIFANLNQLQEILIQNELLNYLDYLQRNRSYFDSSTIQLINILSFNPNLSNYPEEKALAIGIIGILMSGSSEQTTYYFYKFGLQQDTLDCKLLQVLIDPIAATSVRRMTCFALSNIFGETNFYRSNMLQLSTIIQFLQHSNKEQDIEVLLEILQALRNLIYNTNVLNFKTLIDNKILSIIIEHDYSELVECQVSCLLHLIHRFQNFDLDQLIVILNCQHYKQYFFQEGIYFFVKNMFERTREPSVELQQLCEILFSN